jgi:hypothetical protein
MKKIYFIFSLLIIFLLTLSYSQTNLSYARLEGNIYHKEDGKPIEGAMIKILGTDCVGFSDEDGKYVIKNIPIVGDQETYTIEIYEPNFNTVTLRKMETIKSGINQMDFNISLSQFFKKYYKTIDIAHPFSIKLTNDSCYIISGIITPKNTSKNDLYLLKIDKYGRKVWGRTYSIGQNIINAYVDVNNNNEFIVTATIAFQDQGYNIYFLKLDSNGKIIWEKNTGRSDWDEVAHDFIITNEGDYVVVGYVNLRNDKDVKKDNYIVRFNKNGEKIWDKVYGGKDNDYFKRVTQAVNGDYIVVGWTTPDDKPSYSTYYRIDKNGNIIWNKKITTDAPNFARGIISAPQGYVIVGIVYRNTSEYKNTIGTYWVNIDDKGDVLSKKEFFTKGRDNVVESITRNSKSYILTGFVNFHDKRIPNSYILKVDLKGDFVGEIIENKDYPNFIPYVINEKDIYFIFLGYTEQDNDKDIFVYKLSL